MGREKPTVRKVDGRWTATRPGFGFGARPTVKQFHSHQSAVRWALGTGAATTAQVEQAY